MKFSQAFVVSASFLVLFLAASPLSATAAALDNGELEVNGPVAVPYFVHAKEGDESESSAEPSVEPEPSTAEKSSEEVCVDASYLSSYAAHDLVHATHIRAIALCPVDSTLPCATADHMVRVDGVRMSYRELCALGTAGKCESRRMPVNSVLSHKWVEQTHGKVKLTMYDARHPEFVQLALHRLIEAHRSIARRFN